MHTFPSHVSLQKAAWISAIALSALLSTGCSREAAQPYRVVTTRTNQPEIELGEAFFVGMQQIQGGVLATNPSVTKYVNGVFKEIIQVCERPDFPYELVLLNSSVPDCWSLPGGKVAISRAMLLHLGSEAELAALLAKEIAHITSGHGIKQLEAAAAESSFQIHLHHYHPVYSQKATHEANEKALSYLSRSRYDITGLLTLEASLLEVAQKREGIWWEGYFSSHPPSPATLKVAKEFASQYREDGILGFHEYLTAISSLNRRQSLDRTLEQGFSALQKKDFSTALSLGREVVRTVKFDPQGHFLIACSLEGLGESAAALRAYNYAIRHNPRHYAYYLKRGLLHEGRGNSTLADQDLTTSTELCPTSEAHYALGNIRLKEGEMESALEHYQIASQDRSPTGLKASRKLASLELPAAPDRYFSVEAKAAPEGVFRVTTQNKSPLDVQDLVITLQEFQEGIPINKRQLRFNQIIRSGQKAIAEIDLKEFHSDEIQLTVSSAHVIQ